VLVALHGMGGAGDQFASDLIAQADRNHWLLVAPTIAYGDWTDPVQVAREDPALIHWLSDYLDTLPTQVGLPLRPRVLLLGHSRGAQLAHRFALFQPHRVLAVAAVAAGTYTLPAETGPQGGLLRFPFGLGDMASVWGQPFDRAHLVEGAQFWVGVGTADNNSAELPRAWDPYIGASRVERAAAFQKALHAAGAQSVLVEFRGARHVFTAEMANSACAFLRGLDLAQSEPLPASTLHQPHPHA
jgi:pimeloyl-ACP methyl ester carboxylesterase